MRRFLAEAVTALLLCVGAQAASNPAPKVEAPKAHKAAKPTAKTPKAQLQSAQSQAQKSHKSKLAGLFRRHGHKKAQVGTASWYGEQFDGRPTASGEPFDMTLFTAAHKELPLGTWAKVTNLKNGKWVIVRINDRGPYVGDRVLDVSSSAADALDLKAKGTAKVKIEVVDPEEFAALALGPSLF